MLRFPNRAVHALLIAAVAAAVYANTLRHGFVVDDLHQVVDNPRITSLSNVPQVFSEGVWDFEGRTSSYYRPAMYVLYMLVHRFAGTSPPAYHAANVLLHAACSLLVLFLASAVMGRRGAGAAAAGLLFAVHPIHTEPVNWVAGAADLGAGAFGLAVTALHAGAGGERASRRVLAGGAFLVAMLFKEIAVVVPAVLLVHDLLRRPSRSAAVWLARAVPYAAALAVYAALRIHALGGAAPTVAPDGPPPIAWMLSVLALLASYVGKCVVPVGLAFWAPFSPPGGLADPRVLLGACAVIAMACAAWWGRRRLPELTFATALFALPLAPALYLRGLNQGIEGAFAERYLYLPSAGAVLAAGIGVEALRRRGGAARRAGTAIAAATIVLFSAMTWVRNPVWRDSVSLWEDSARRYPANAIARQNLGFALLHAKRVEEGRAELREAVRLDPSLVERDVRKGAVYVANGLWKKAVITLQGALAMDERSAAAYFHLGAAYEGLGWTGAAEQAYRTSASLDPANPVPWNNLGVLLATSGRLEAAAAAFETALRLAPGDPEIRANLERAQIPRSLRMIP